MNAQFMKPDKYLCTYREMGVKGPPYVRHNYETTDYNLTLNNWKTQ